MTEATPGESGRAVSARRSSLTFVGFVVLCFAAASVAGWATSLSVGTWYPTLAKPWFHAA
jgi:translocator protein